jgi:hypothetical protein
MSSVETATPIALVQRIFERLNNRDADALMQFLADRSVEHWPVVGAWKGHRP